MTDRILERRVFMCRDHQFVIQCAHYGNGKGGRLDCRKSPGNRGTNCDECEQAVDDAMGYIRGAGPGFDAARGGG